MKLRKIFIISYIMVCALISVWLAGCTDQTPDNQTQRNGDTHAVNGAVTGWQKEKYEFEKDMHEKIAQLNRKLGNLEGKAENAAGRTKDMLEEQTAQLEKQLGEAKAKLDDLDNATAATWEVTKTEIKTAFDNVEQAFDRAAEPNKSRQ